ncbi:unnamed protein product [Phytophthora fragariaefolia]|uniref:Unnamed protein product n=1 Tax=Phytophthora fragariaefolia TaxID=1490495 RepID=A0A9W6XUC0_9STRA|nr:unnamed protein product [Phytophthora fragariaefolia]
MPAAPGSADLQRQPSHGGASSSGPRPALHASAPSAQAAANTSTSPRLSIAQYRAEHVRKHGPTVMSERNSSQAGAQLSSKPTRSRDVLFEDFGEEMVSPTEDQGARPELDTAHDRLRALLRARRRGRLRVIRFERPINSPNVAQVRPLPSRDDAEGSNDLDEAQSRQLDGRREASRSIIPAALPLVKKSRKDYRFGGSKDPAKEVNELAKGLLVECLSRGPTLSLPRRTRGVSVS